MPLQKLELVDESLHRIISTLRWGYSGEQLEYAIFDGSCRSTEVIAYLDALAKRAADNSEEVVMDNAPSYTATVVR